MNKSGAITAPLAVLALVLISSAVAGQAVSLSAGFTPEPCPGVCTCCTFTSPGNGVPLGVSAIDSLGNRDAGYTGTVTFSSSDPLATLPMTYTFTAADAGHHYFPADTVFQTLGRQTLIVTDAPNGLSTSASIQVVASETASIPVMAIGGVLVTLCSLGILGAWLVNRRS